MTHYNVMDLAIPLPSHTSQLRLGSSQCDGEETPMISLLNQLPSDQVLTQAYRWLCKTRAHYHHNDDVWHVRYWWATHKPRLQAQLRTGTYRLSECLVVQGRERRPEIWCAMDALC